MIDYICDNCGEILDTKEDLQYHENNDCPNMKQ